MPKSKFFRVATEGATADGRNIERAWIEQAAKNFHPAKYGARVWLEHIRGIVPGSPFDALGDVTALEAREVENGKRALFAQIEPLPALIDLSKRGQKIYTSMELDTKFADSGEAYLVGLAVTDNPASLGTEVLKFAATAQTNPFASRHTSPGALFTEAVPFTLELEDPPMPDTESAVKKLLGIFSNMIGAHEKTTPGDHDRKPDVAPAAPETGKVIPDQFTAAFAQMAALLQTFAAGQAAIGAQIKAIEARHDALVLELSRQPGGAGRPAATGSDGRVLADC